MLYSDISPRLQAYSDRRLLERATPLLVLQQWGQVRPLPKKKTQTIKFRRYEALDPVTTPLAEGVTPTGATLTVTDISATVYQYGQYVQLTDVIMDTHEDPVLNETVDILAEQAAESVEKIRFGILKAGTSVRYANGTSRSAVNTTVEAADLKLAIRDIESQNGKPFTKVIRPSDKVNTMGIQPSFVGYCHPYVQYDLEDLTDFLPTSQYAQGKEMQGEFGAYKRIRFCASTIAEGWLGAGASGGTGVQETGGNADVYPILVFGRNAYGITPLGNKTSAETYIKPLGSAGAADPLNQRGTAGWKTWQTAVILNDLFMVRIEVAVSA